MLSLQQNILTHPFFFQPGAGGRWGWRPVGVEVWGLECISNQQCFAPGVIAFCDRKYGIASSITGWRVHIKLLKSYQEWRSWMESVDLQPTCGCFWCCHRSSVSSPSAASSGAGGPGACYLCACLRSTKRGNGSCQRFASPQCSFPQLFITLSRRR